MESITGDSIYGNTIILNNINSQGIFIKKTNGTSIRYNDIYVNNKNSTAIKFDLTNNIQSNSNTIKLNNTDTIAISVNNSNSPIIYLNTIESLNNTNDNIAPIILNNTNNSNITKNNITTTSKYTIIVNNQSNNNKITNNILYADNLLGDDSVLNINKDYNKVLDNNPEYITYFYLNEKTYNKFFDEKGNLKDIIPENITILATGNLYNKILTINKPINLKADGITYINTIINITKQGANTNITGLTLTNESQIIIDANKCNIEISKMDLTRNNEKTVLNIIGNNNTIQIGQIEVTCIPDTKLNITVIEITGNNNKINNTGSITTHDFNKVYGILLNNANNNKIFNSALWLYGRNSTNIFFNNSNNNTIFTNQNDLYATEANEGIVLRNSSYNKISGRVSTNNLPTISMLRVEDNSNFNRFERLTLMGNDIQETKVHIINSNYNTILGGYYTFKSLIGYGINITESVGNNISYISISTSNLEGNDAIIQENKNESLNNIVRYNAKFVNVIAYGNRTRANITIPNSAKIYDTITINATAEYSKGKYMMVPSGQMVFRVNGEIIGIRDVINGTATMNYTITSTDELFFDVIYEDPTLAYTIAYRNATLNVEKLDSKILMANTTNNGMQTTTTALIMDEKGNIIYDGNVTFTLGSETKTVSIENGIAQATFNTSKYKPSEYEITAIFNGNNITLEKTSTAILNVIKYDVNMLVDPVSIIAGKTTTLKAIVTDENGNLVDGGRVVFKLNGCTLKDVNGNAICGNVISGIATINYTIPSTYTSKDYILTAVASDDKYNRIESNSTLTVTKRTSNIITPTTAKRTNNTQFTINLTDENGNKINSNQKVCIKFNGCTIINTKAVNGTVNVNLDLTEYKNKQYNMTIICGENSQYNMSQMMSILSIE